MVRAVAAVFIGLALAGKAVAQSAPPPAALAGRVVDGAGAPLPHARVTLAPLGRSVATDASGRFAFPSLPHGTYRVHATLMGYAMAVRELAVGPTGTEVTFVLEPTPLTLEEVQVTATATAADARAVAQATTQLTGKSLERNLAGTVAQTLAAQPGIRVRYNGPAAAVPIMRGLSGDRILILQDGQRSADLAGSAVDHAVTIDPLTAQRIEVVRGPATLLYGNNALGGVVNVISGDIPTSVPSRVEGVMVGQSESAFPGGGGSFRVNAPAGERWAVTLRAGGRT
ncbi:MAG TPA: TonB-dependent receptor plug domain-containing protein, partial [Longimicrobium sp.]